MSSALRKPHEAALDIFITMHPETLHLLNTLTLLSLSSDSPEKHRSDALSPSPSESECEKAQNCPVKVMAPTPIDESKNLPKEMTRASQNVAQSTTERDCICKYMSLHTRSELGVCLDCLNPHNGFKRVRSTALFNSSMLARSESHCPYRMQKILTNKYRIGPHHLKTRVHCEITCQFDVIVRRSYGRGRENPCRALFNTKGQGSSGTEYRGSGKS